MTRSTARTGARVDDVASASYVCSASICLSSTSSALRLSYVRAASNVCLPSPISPTGSALPLSAGRGLNESRNDMRRQLDHMRAELAAALARNYDSPRSHRSRREHRRDPSRSPSDDDHDDHRGRGRQGRSRDRSTSRSRSRNKFRDKDVGYLEPDDSKAFIEVRDKLRVYHNVHSFIKAAKLAESTIRISSMKRRFAQCFLG